MKKFIALVLTMLVAFSLCACGKETDPDKKQLKDASSGVLTEKAETRNDGIDYTKGEPISLTGASSTTGTKDDALKLFFQLLEERSGGRITVTHIAPGVMGNAELAEGIMMGTLNAAFVPDAIFDSVIGGGLAWTSLPGLVSNYDEVDEYYRNGWIGEEVQRILAEKNIKALAFFDVGFRSVGSKDKPIAEPIDLKGLKIRTASVTAMLTWYESIGTLPTSVAEAEVLTALQQGIVDAVDNNPYAYYTNGIADELRYVTNMNYLYSAGQLCINGDLWNSLSDTDKQLFQECAEIACASQDENVRELCDDLIAEQKASGQWEVLEREDLSEEMISFLDEKAVEVWSQFESGMDSELYAKCMEHLAR